MPGSHTAGGDTQSLVPITRQEADLAATLDGLSSTAHHLYLQLAPSLAETNDPRLVDVRDQLLSLSDELSALTVTADTLAYRAESDWDVDPIAVARAVGAR